MGRLESAARIQLTGFAPDIDTTELTPYALLILESIPIQHIRPTLRSCPKSNTHFLEVITGQTAKTREAIGRIKIKVGYSHRARKALP